MENKRWANLIARDARQRNWLADKVEKINLPRFANWIRPRKH